MIASLPMYATPHTAGADARFWGLIRDGLHKQGVDAPDALTAPPTDLLAHWRNPKLIFSQTCGFPFRAVLKDDVSLIGTPDYGVAGCPPGYYCSHVIARDDDPRVALSAFKTARFAYNDAMSQSGWAALALEAPEVLQGPRLCTGGHRLSAIAVRQGDADFATIDAVTWQHLDAAGETGGLKILHSTSPTPGLPYITSKSGPVDALFAATAQAITALPSQDRAVLHLEGLVALPPSAYALPLPPPAEAIRS
ncbi:phosphate/phosphite/phosphonate ABC transporter substrate-binding protein [Loktanella sp. Alg231-35]|uniref:phosphate/phosphite/phosphonate ABC transporter substrate-binding protein n=1 Tax=Loktanella sp. Alg231-35 TaxID=1922220 RepID=UPI000D5518FA|nr:PhnD/SsuA/transferrin family substrate-binding protein [Loktanella sp. Alg231-35]